MNLNRNPMYLSGTTRRNQRRQSIGNLATVGFLALVMAVNYWVFLSDDRTPITPGEAQRALQQSKEPAVESPVQPILPPVDAPAEELPSNGGPGGAQLAGTLTKGQSLLGSLKARGVDDHALLPLIHTMERVFDFKNSRVGDKYTLEITEQGDFERLAYEVSPLEKYEVVPDSVGGFIAAKEAVNVEIEIAEMGCPVHSSLYESIRRCGEDAHLAAKLIDLLAWDMDFFQDVHKGDEIRMIVEKKKVDGTFLAYGEVLAAEYRGHVSTQRFFWYTDDKHNVADFYTEDGDSVRKEFLKTPLKFSRISSGYSHHRYHPVLHRYKQHLGIDYAAPVGTPIWSVASGTVTKIGKKGPSGNLVAVKHANGFTSYYAHLSRFAKGIKVGDHVEQKSIVGFVGMTGRATGPHLHFGLKHKGRFVNPQKIKYTTANPLPAAAQPEFQKVIELRLEQLKQIQMGDSGPLRS
jgi:murein DD-endopeptidase MepM/ murein hydrolase activator NlpD